MQRITARQQSEYIIPDLLERNTFSSSLPAPRPPGSNADRWRTFVTWLRRLPEILGISRVVRTSRKRLKEADWRLGLLMSCCASGLVLIANFVLLVVGASKYDGYQDGIGTLAKGNSNYISQVSTVHHIMINFLSTVLLTASSYCMQITCAPSRSEIDAAHKDGTWLDIGILSLHNFSYISKRRRMILILLSFSSLPLHLCYNSAIFEVTKGHSYTIHYVSSSNISEIDRINNTMDRLENHEWMERYSTQYVSDSTDLYFIVDRVGFDMILANETWEITSPTSWNPSQFGTLNFPANDSSFPMMSSIDGASHGLSDLGISFQWPEPLFVNATITTGLDKVFDFSAKDEDGFWNLHSGGRRAPATPWPLRIQYAFAQPTTTSSQVQCSLVFLLIVIFCNLLKCVLIYDTYRNSSERRVITLGDAVASFLNRPEESTAGMCLANRHSIVPRHSNKAKKQDVCEVQEWTEYFLRYSQINIEHTWWSRIVVLILTTSTSAILIVSLQYMPQAPTWGTKSITILSFAPQSFDSKGILLNSVIPNIPHVLLSFTYFAINRICTSNHFVKEWNGYGTTRKGLRVSKPSGQQRKTYNLQLPYSWAIPLTATSGSLHWLASQSIFLTRLELYDENGDIILHGEDKTLLSKCTTGYSALSALVFALVVITLMLTIWWFARSKIQVDVPVSAHCSLAIAAACHPPSDEETPHLKPVQWGVARNEIRPGVKHCTFTSEPVTAPVPGELYA